jgi:hypothetical protein
MARVEKNMMRRRALLGIALVLVLAVAACGDDDETVPPGDGAPTAEGQDVAATEEVAEPMEFVPLEPGVNVQAGLTLLTYSVGIEEGTGYFFGEVRNDTGENLRQVYAVLYPLDAENYPTTTIPTDSLLTDIPPSQTIVLSRTFSAPENVVDAQVWVRHETGDPMLQGYFDLPGTVEANGSDPAAAYLVQGTAENTSGVDLTYPVVDVILIGPDDNLIGVAHGVFTGGVQDGVWPAGETVAFDARFDFVLSDIAQVRDVRIAAAGYAPLP